MLAEGANVIIHKDFYKYTLEEYISENQKLEELIKDIKNNDLSPFEKYLAIYDLVKHFKKYRECPEDKKQARYIKNLLDNDYMVCVGFSNFLVDLLGRVGIESSEIGVDLYDHHKAFFKRTGHSRVIVNINDPKYDISGYYLADPTWDSSREHNYYIFSSMTFEEVTRLNDIEFLDKSDYFFNIFDMNDFNYKVNLLIDKQKESSELDKLKSIYYILNKIFRNIDCEFHEEIQKIVPFYSNYKINLFYDLLTIVGNHLVNHTNKPITADTLLDAIINYKQKLGVLQDNESTLSIAEEQIKEQELNFLKIEIDSQINGVYIINPENKFKKYIKEIKNK